MRIVKNNMGSMKGSKTKLASGSANREVAFDEAHKKQSAQPPHRQFTQSTNMARLLHRTSGEKAGPLNTLHRNKLHRSSARICVLFALMLLMAPTSAFAQGSVFGTVQNSDLTFPANGQISFFGFLDDTDEEIRIETSTGAGYDNGNWFDDFQNYLTEASGNPYDYYFVNPSVNEGHHLGKLIPNNSFQQENILLAPIGWPGQPTSLNGFAVSTSTVELTWSKQLGLTYHVYRRAGSSNGSFFRIDDPTGNLANTGVSDSFYVDATVDGVSSYDYLIIAQNATGDYSPHSAVITVNSASLTGPILFSITPSTGITLGGTPVEIFGNGFDLNGAGGTIGGVALTNVVVLSPMHMTATTPVGVSGPADVIAFNTASGLFSNTLVGAFTYTVNNPPVLAPIGPQTLAEGVVLSILVSATDVDGGFPILTASPIPSGATFIDNGDGTGSFNWPTTFFDAGVYNVTFIATDNVQSIIADSEQVVITINEAGNQIPVLAAIGAQSVLENTSLSFVISATDGESTPALSAVGIPAGASFLDNGGGSGSFSWTPDFTQSGLYNVTFIATDDSLVSDTEIVAITVIDAKNQPPVLNAIGAQSTTEGIALGFVVSASDPESIPALSASGLPAGASFVDGGNGSGTFSWTPGALDAGLYSVIFTATDDSLVVDSETVAITVTEGGNLAPVWTTVGPQSVTENVNLNFIVSATDAESVPALAGVGLPAGATLTDNGDGTGVFDWTPNYLQSGIYTINLTATDDSLVVTTETLSLTVIEAGNQLPILSPIGPQLGTENVALSFSVTGSDIESIPALSAIGLPSGAVFTDNLNGTASFNWTPSLIQAGVYNVTFVATDDSLAADSELVTITIQEVGNQLPVLSAIGGQSVSENIALSVALTASDVESIPVLSSTALPAGAILTDNGDGTGSFDWTPSFVQSGVYAITFYASDDSLAVDSEVVTITVVEVGNQTPVLNSIGAKLTSEGVTLAFTVVATDAESIPQLLVSGLPPGATFVDNLNGTGSFSWTPNFFQAASYNLQFFAQDDSLSVVSETIIMTVTEAGNQAPVLSPIGAQTVSENANLNLLITASDAESVPSFIAGPIPAGATFTDNGDGTAIFNWTPTFLQAGVYSMLVTAIDDSTASDTETVTITVTESGNQSPVLTPIGAQTVSETANLSLLISATDAESIPLLTTTALPTGATFIDSANGRGLFDWTPTALQSGVYSVTFFATDADLSVDSEVVSITVTDGGNVAPLFALTAPQSGIENQLLQFTVSATDPESVPTLFADSLPVGAAFTDNLNGTGLFSWTPTFLQTGVYNVIFVATDDSLAVDSQIVTVTITDGGNQLPILSLIGPQTVTELLNLNFAVSATDIESIPSLSAVGLPLGAVFTDSGNGIGTFDWTPSQADGGIYSVTFIATDDSLAIDSEIVTITVLDIGNAPPVIDSISAKSINEGSALSFTVSAGDVESIPSLTAIGLPLGATFVDSALGTGYFNWTPDFTQAGNYSVTFVATDDSLVTDSEFVSITVIEVGNQPPIITVDSVASVAENATLVMVITAVDPEAAGAVFITSVTSLSNSVFVDSGNGVATLTYTPDFFDAGIDTLRVFATDAGSPPSTAQTVILITTIEVNQPPTVDSIGPQAILTGRQLVFDLVARDSTDPDISHRVELTVVNLPLNATFTDNLNSTGTFTFNPVLSQVGVDTVRFLAIDQGLPPLTKIVDVVITVVAQNQAPVLASIPPVTVDEGASVSFQVTATDPDGNPISISMRNEPANSSLIDNGNGTAQFTFNPDFTQGGSAGASLLYSVTFIVFDGIDDDREQALIQVMDAGNQKPIFSVLRDTSVVEGAFLSHTVQASDPDGDPVSLTIDESVDLLPANASFVDNGDGSGTLEFSPNFIQAGIYTIVVSASDGLTSTLGSFVVNVIEAGNQTPTLAFDSLQLNHVETDLISFTLISTDPDSTSAIMTAVNVPAGATFVDNADGSGTFTWQTQNLDVGNYNVIFFATDPVDALLYDSAVVNMDIVDSNFIPLIFPVVGQTRNVNEGQTLTYVVTASDADGTIPILSTDTLFENMSFIDSGNGVGVLTFNPDFTQGSPSPGTPYNVNFIATDAVDPTRTKDTSPQLFLVVHVNQPPIVNAVASPVSVIEGNTLAFSVSASDPDLASPSTSFPVLRAENLPPNATAVHPPSGDLTQLNLVFSPDFTQSGTYQVNFIASDTQAEDTLTVQIDVTEAGNQTPVWLTILQDTTLVVAGTPTEIPLLSTDADLDNLTLSVNFAPSGALLIDSGNGAGLFRYNADAFDVGNTFLVEFYTTDPSLAVDTIRTVFVIRSFLRGDANTDARIDLTDVVFLIDYMFRGGSEPVSVDAADVNFDGRIQILDVTFLTNYLFRQGPPPPN